MRRLAADEIVDLERYDAIRSEYRDAVIAHKRNRRLSVGEIVTLLFEDRETLRFQVQEMVQVERITAPDRVQHELDVYNELMPGDGEISATLFIEITDLPDIRRELDRLVGIDEHVALVLGEGDDEQVVRARFDTRQLEEDRISAVHYLKFPLGDAAKTLADPASRVRVRIDHPHYARDEDLPPAVRASLVAGLRGEGASLLPALPVRPATDRVLFETERVRAIAPARPAAPGHVVVEPREPVASLLDAGEELLAELMRAVQRAAADVARRHGGCRIVTQIGGGADGLRWHLHAPPE